MARIIKVIQAVGSFKNTEPSHSVISRSFALMSVSRRYLKTAHRDFDLVVDLIQGRILLHF